MHKTLESLHKTPDPSSPSTGLRLVTASTHSAGQQQNFPVHKHGAWELIYYRAGRIQCVVAGEVFHTQPGMLLIIPPETLHFDLALTAYRQVYVHVQCESVPGWSQVYRDDSEGTLSALFAGLVREYKGRAPDRAEMLGLLLRQLSVVLRRKKVAPETASERLVQTAERLLEERLSLSSTVKDVAAEVGVSPSTLRAHFVKLRGYAPKTYLCQVRQRRALELISNSTLSLADIAELCGFDSASHLSRYIKRDTGRTPGSFRNRS